MWTTLSKIVENSHVFVFQLLKKVLCGQIGSIVPSLCMCLIEYAKIDSETIGANDYFLRFP